MNKLHFWEKGYKVADGKGVLNANGFTATITKSYRGVQKGKIYEVRQETKTSGDDYSCVGQDNQKAIFGKKRKIKNTLFDLANTTKKLNIEIALRDLRRLKNTGYKLCFAKKVNNRFNVIWEASGNYLHKNEISWMPIYELFASDEFSGGKMVKVTTNIEKCALGQTCVLDKQGLLKSATIGGTDTSLGMINTYGLIHPGVNQLVIGIDGLTAMNPIYVAEKPIVSRGIGIIPKDVIRIWFQKDANTSTMISNTKSAFIDLDFTNIDTLSCKYEKGSWYVYNY